MYARRRPARGAGVAAMLLGLLAALALWAQPAQGHTAGDLGMSEAQLREAETKMLGPTHAAEHARQRALAPEPGLEAAGASSAEDRSGQYRAAGPPADVGRWGAPFPIPIIGITSVVLPTGKVMWWSYPNGDRTDNTAQAWLWDPRTGATKRVDPPLALDPSTGQMKPANIWCSGQSLLADGRVLVTGGNLDYAGGEFKGLNKVYTFNPYNETWTEQPDMAHGRWYPTQVMQPDGRTLIFSGSDESGGTSINTDIELFTPSPDMNGVGTIKKIAQAEASGDPAIGGPPARQLYPRMHLMPSGRTMVSGPDNGDTWFFDLLGPADAFTWAEREDFSDARIWGTSVLAPGTPGGSSRVTIIGGTGFFDQDTPRETTETFDDAAPAGGWQAGPSLNIGRSHHNTVLLPDGSMVTVGGGVGSRPPEGQFAFDASQRQIELFDPATKSWRLGPEQAEGRAYHSTAVLLPDGRVLSAGDDYNGGQAQDTAEIYEPPYLFKGARPAIDSAPESIAWGDTFGVYSNDSVSRAVLVAPGATTHGVDMNQRHAELQVENTVAGLGVNVAAPPSPTVAPPGYYMLFVLNEQGVPSVARWVRLDPAAPARPELIAGGGATLATKGGKGKLTTVKAKGRNLILPISCDPPGAGAAGPCVGRIEVTANARATGRAKPKRLTIGSGTYSVRAGATTAVRVRLSRRGRLLVRRNGKITATVTLFDTINDARARTRVRL